MQVDKIIDKEEQIRLLEGIFQQALNDAGWLKKDGSIKKDIAIRKKNIKIKNIQKTIGHWDQNKDIVLLRLSFDVYFQTEKEEAIHHKDTYWAVNADKRYNIDELGKGLERMMFRIQNQMVFTTKIDKNLYKFWELDKKGWKITKN